jgi:hypothetical protein
MTLLLMALAALTGYGLFVLASPAAACRTCSGWGLHGRRWATRGRRWRGRATCRRCGGTGVRFRPGARIVHCAAAALIRHRATGTGLPIPPWRPPRTRPGRPDPTSPRERRTPL